MKKLFFFKSSSNNGSSNVDSPPSTEKQVYWENPLESGSPRGAFLKSRKQLSESNSSVSGSRLRRSRSLSSAAFLVDGNRSPSSASSTQQQLHKHLPGGRGLNRERQSRTKHSEIGEILAAHALEQPGSSGTHHDSSSSSSYCSSNVSTTVIDRYIEGEEQLERSRPKNSSQRNNSGSGNGCGRLPPKVHYAASILTTDSSRDKPRSQSFREAKGTCLHFSSRDWVENGFGHESPRSLAKNVIEKLSQTRTFPRSNLKEPNHDVPITIEDVYGGSLNRCLDPDLDVLIQKSHAFDGPYKTVNRRNDYSGLKKQDCYFTVNPEGLNSFEEEDLDVELERKSKEAEERVMLLSEQLEEESFLRDSGIDIPSLIQTIRHLTEEKLNLALEVSGLLQSRILDRASAKEELIMAKVDLESRTKKLEKEKDELQLGLEKELDRRSGDWSVKLEKYQFEEQRLRERVRELAEHNVSLQREVSSFNQRETESRSMITYSEQQLKELTKRVEELSNENQDLRRNLSEVQEKYRATSEDVNCIKRNFEEKENECKELQKSITRLLRTCSEQEKTIEGLREGYAEELGKKHSSEQFDKQVAKLQMEQMRLTGIELSLRRELESYRVEVDSLRHENINLLDRLKGNGKNVGALTFKLDKEMWTRVCYLQNQGLSMLNESNQLCSRLLAFIKGKGNQQQETQHDLELFRNGLNGQFLVECDMKVQGFKRGTENLTRSLQTTSSLLHEKSSELQSQEPNRSRKLNDQEITQTELKAEILLTSLLREKLYSKELEVEQLQAELAAAVRGNDILRCEVQNAMDNISCLTHRLKDLELQMLKKDDNINHLQNDLQESTKELTIMKGILPKISEERDLMWEEVKQYNEKNMLLNSEVNLLKKKIETLDEDILLKEGQITILKDALGNKTFDLLACPDSMHELLLK
ncbi:hypothetical protein SLEP1_g5620 [Rubroshorea leprosula]|uniref:DUF7653 domain-containing protein n=1 Tax=Rubroshorea leprosula TaxID=152421 RepID=A0AAV5HSV0_9ROSI|nr:hypothetical protein SLEP1_g5620 [Rubroshorea leprosula]